MLDRVDPEVGHGLAVRALKFAPAANGPDDPRLGVQAFDLAFPNPLGIAAGFDKHGEVVDAVLRIGCGFAEIGSVTPLPQPGNPRPRLFRLPLDEGVINRYGFNSEGHAAVLARLRTRASGGIVGVNVGANKTAADFGVDRMVRGTQAVYDSVLARDLALRG